MSTETISAQDGAVQSTQSPQQVAIMQRLGFLQDALLSQDPQLKGHLAEIHKLLITNEELVHLLSDEDIAKVMGAQQLVTNTTLIAATTGKKATTSVLKKVSQLTLGDL